MSILTERRTNDLDICAEQAIDSIISMIPSDTEMTGDETSDSDSSHHSMVSPSFTENIYSSLLPLAPITMHPRAINRVILNHKSSLEKFILFLNINNDAKNLVEFWIACESLSKTKDNDYRKNSKQVYYRFIRSNALQRVTLSKGYSDAIKNAFHGSGDIRSAMEFAQTDAFNILQLEAFPQFKSTLYYQTLLKDPLFLSLCSVPPPPPSSVCSSCFSIQSSICTKFSDSSISPESEKSSHRHEIQHEDCLPKKNYSRSKRRNEITNVDQFAAQIVSHIEKEIENRIKFTREVQESLRSEGKHEEIINCSDWTSHPIRIKYIQLNREPEESNVDVYDVISSTSEDIQHTFQNEPEMQADFKCEPVFNSMQFMMNKPLSHIDYNTKQVSSSASDILPLANASYDNIQINRFFQGIEARQNQPGRVKNAGDAALQLLQNAHANMDVDSTTNWAERKSTQRKRRHSYHRSGSQRSLLADTTSINSDSVAFLPPRHSSRVCYYPNRQESDVLDNGSQIHYYATLPRKGTLQHLQQQQHLEQQSQQQQQQRNELQVFYRVGENSPNNLFTRVQHTSKTPFVLRDFIHKVFKRRGDFRYYFKSFSMDLNESVWEEIIHEDFPVPEHNGKIMALVVPHPSS
uniref:Axin n=1 Tax=Oopsacas minuta TaxID=111878 RepID=A0A2H4G9I6_9METZ|nr:Axin [Oopsacas minuta]